MRILQGHCNIAMSHDLLLCFWMHSSNGITPSSHNLKQLINESLLLQDCGVFSIVLECVKTSLAKQITENLKIPTIGIGSSAYCDGQVLVTDDLIGLNNTKIKFVKKFINIKKYINLGFKKFSSEVKSKKYPLKKHSY